MEKKKKRRERPKSSIERLQPSILQSVCSPQNHLRFKRTRVFPHPVSFVHIKSESLYKVGAGELLTKSPQPALIYFFKLFVSHGQKYFSEGKITRQAERCDERQISRFKSIFPVTGGKLIVFSCVCTVGVTALRPPPDCLKYSASLQKVLYKFCRKLILRLRHLKS